MLDLILFIVVDLAVEVLHELVKMNTTFPSIHSTCRVEQVHQVALSRTHITVQINASRDARNGAHHASAVWERVGFCHLQQLLVREMTALSGGLLGRRRCGGLTIGFWLFPGVIELTIGSIATYFCRKAWKVIDGRSHYLPFLHGAG